MILKHYYYIDILLLHCKLLRNFFGGVYGNWFKCSVIPRVFLGIQVHISTVYSSGTEGPPPCIRVSSFGLKYTSQLA